MNTLLIKIIRIIIKSYQIILSPVLGPSCRFMPSCSEYAYEAFGKYGILKGLLLTVRRISKCHPFNPGGYDPLP